MLRRIARLIRVLFAVAAGVVVIWLPFSFWWLAHLQVVGAGQGLSVSSSSGLLSVQFVEVLTGSSINLRTDPSISIGGREDAFDTGIAPLPERSSMSWHPALWPAFSRGPFGPVVMTSLRIPLWLLAAVCLAWPVTSFIVARWRRGRGFEVETEVRDQKSEVSQSAAGSTPLPLSVCSGRRGGLNASPGGGKERMRAEG
jgi:hypothetical protein